MNIRNEFIILFLNKNNINYLSKLLFTQNQLRRKSKYVDIDFSSIEYKKFRKKIIILMNNWISNYSILNIRNIDKLNIDFIETNRFIIFGKVPKYKEKKYNFYKTNRYLQSDLWDDPNLVNFRNNVQRRNVDIQITENQLLPNKINTQQNLIKRLYDTRGNVVHDMIDQFSYISQQNLIKYNDISNVKKTNINNLRNILANERCFVNYNNNVSKQLTPSFCNFINK